MSEREQTPHTEAESDPKLALEKQKTAQNNGMGMDDVASNSTFGTQKHSQASTMYSSNATPLGKKFRHTFVPIDPERINRELHEQRVKERERQEIAELKELAAVRARALSLVVVEPLIIETFDQGTQVYSRTPDFESGVQCEFAGCLNIADGGSCDYRVCFSKGCKRAVCNLHMVQPDEDTYDDALKSKVCVDCESRANRAFLLTIALVILVPLMAIIPAIILNGGDQTMST